MDHIEPDGKELKDNILKDIVYITSLYRDTPGGANPFLSNIPVRERGYIDFRSGGTLRFLENKDFVSPFNIISAKVKDRMDEFYAEIGLSIPEGYLKYGDALESTAASVDRLIENRKKSAIAAIIHEYRRCARTDEPIKETIDKIARILERDAAFLKTLLARANTQLMQNALL